MLLNNEIYFIRHAENTYDNNLKNDDLPLTKRGKKQCIYMSKILNDNFDYIYCSTSLRAFETARLITNSNNICKDNKLIERGWGNNNGLETDYEAKVRIEKFIEENIINKENKRILIVTHGSLMRLIQDVIEENCMERNRVYNCTSINYNIMGHKQVTHLPNNIRS